MVTAVGGGGGVWLRVALAVLVRPSLWPVAVAQGLRLARRGWWRRFPFLPVPDGDYLRWRLETMYGREVERPEVGDVLTYLRWCRTFPA